MNVFYVENHINDYRITTPLKSRKNNNFVSKIIKTIIDYSEGATLDTKNYGNLTNNYNRASSMFISRYYKDDCLVDYIKRSRGRIHIINYIWNFKYFKAMEINAEYFVTNLNDSSFTFLKEGCLNDITCSHYNTKLINKIDLSNKFDKLYDIFERNGNYYLFSIELLEIHYSKMLNTAYVAYIDDGKIHYQNIDYLLYVFVKQFRYLLIDLCGFDTLEQCENNISIHGIYKIKIEPLNKTNKSKLGKIWSAKGHINNIDITDYYDTTKQMDDVSEALITFFDTNDTFQNKNRHRYWFFIKNNIQEKQLDDDDLIALFNTTKKIKSIVIIDDDDGSDSDTNEEIVILDNVEQVKEEPNLNISFNKYVINQQHIVELLLQLIFNNETILCEYNKYKSIYVSKDYDKNYTEQKYFNFKFETAYKMENYKASPTYHCYLTADTKEIKSLSFIQHIAL